MKSKKNNLSFDGLNALYKIASILAIGGRLEEVMQKVLDSLAENAMMKHGTISIISKEQDEIVADVAHGLTNNQRLKGRYRLGEGITGKVVESGRPIAVPRLTDEPMFLDKMKVRKEFDLSEVAFLCVPIRAVRTVVGALSADRVAFGNEVTLESELRFLEAVSDLIAQTVLARQKEEEIQKALERENQRLKSRLEERDYPADMVGNSRPMREVYHMITQVADSPATVLIRGETGTGKELVAKAIHKKSPRSGGPFVPVNCGALPEPLLESELFGHDKGAFTGAVKTRKGHFEAAGSGTIFLDEIGELSSSAQTRLLRILQEKSFQRLGGSSLISTDARVLAATNRNLEEMVQEGTFREDLYYRINVFPIHLPPLRERHADILLLADHFVQKYSERTGKSIKRISTPAIDMISAYHWPGNVRELQNTVEQMMV
ncbi:MAG: sigma 54-interacting transcriptional regulator, partial [Fibrobacterota bacterium]